MNDAQLHAQIQEAVTSRQFDIALRLAGELSSAVQRDRLVTLIFELQQGVRFGIKSAITSAFLRIQAF